MKNKTYNSEAHQTLATNLRIMRKKKELTLHDMAVKTGFSYRYLFSIENQQTDACLTVIERAAEVLGCGLCDLLPARHGMPTQLEVDHINSILDRLPLKDAKIIGRYLRCDTFYGGKND